MLQSPLVEQLRERFDHIGIQEVLHWLQVAEEVVTRAGQPLLGWWSPSLLSGSTLPARSSVWRPEGAQIKDYQRGSEQ